MTRCVVISGTDYMMIQCLACMKNAEHTVYIYICSCPWYACPQSTTICFHCNICSLNRSMYVCSCLQHAMTLPFIFARAYSLLIYRISIWCGLMLTLQVETRVLHIYILNIPILHIHVIGLVVKSCIDMNVLYIHIVSRSYVNELYAHS